MFRLKLEDASRRLLVSVVISLFWTPATRADDQTIEMFMSAFLPQSVSVDLSDRVIWVWRAGDHTITSGLPGGSLGAPDEPGVLFDVLLDAEHPSFTYTFLEFLPEGLPFFCRKHLSQIGSVAISNGEATFRVGVVDNFFLPGELFIFEGDSVMWEHELNEGLHTVTSGLSSRPQDHPGALFDVESSNDRPIFVHRFGETGDFPYFCVPHEDMGMKGVIRVQKRFLRGDAQGDGAVDLADVLSLLGFLFLGDEGRACPDAQDSNDDGQVDVGDPIFILFYLFAGGSPPPKPRILPGADRTEDGLFCRS